MTEPDTAPLDPAPLNPWPPDPVGLDGARLAAARLWAASKAPYLAAALFACTPRAAPGSGTVAVDRSWRVHADPQVLATFEAPQLGRLLLHLTGHLLREHADRADRLSVDGEQAPFWSTCGDAEINDDLTADGLLPPVAATLPGDLGCADGRLAEAYYGTPPATLPSRNWDCGSGADGRPRPWDGDGDPGLHAEQAERLRHTVAADVRRAHHNEPGTVPAGWLRWAESVAPSRTDWRRVLAAVIRRAVAAAAGNVDYTYRKPSRRSHTVTAGERAILPSLFRPVIEVVVVCDTSGSMDDDALATVLTEVEAIIARAGLRAHGVAALAVDTEVHESRRVRRAAQVRLAGGGGTDMGAGITAAAARRPRPDVIVVLTDGHTPWPEQPPPGVRVVVGLIEGDYSAPPAPAWAIEVRIPPSGRFWSVNPA